MSEAPFGREEAQHAGEGVGGAEARDKMAAGQVGFRGFSQFCFRGFFDFKFHNNKKGLAFCEYFHGFSRTHHEI